MKPIFCTKCDSPMRATFENDTWECTSLVCDSTLTGAEVIRQRNQTRTNDDR